jgi:4-hydroxy-2-oxoheptanedioate aldolase
MYHCRLRQKLQSKEVVLGPFCKLSEPAIYELTGLAGFDFTIIDLEHGPLSYESAQNVIWACELAGVMTSLNRWAFLDRWVIPI